MPGRGTEPGPALYPECGQPGLGGTYRHRKEGTPTCAGCREQMARHAAGYRKRRYLARGRLKIPAVGTQRRLRALARTGWGQAEIASRLGAGRTAVNRVLGQAMVYPETADRIAALYRDLAWETGPSARVARQAAREGWPGPLDWDDIDNPDEVPACEVERAHREALVMEWNRRTRDRLREQPESDREARLARRRESHRTRQQRRGQDRTEEAACAS